MEMQALAAAAATPLQSDEESAVIDVLIHGGHLKQGDLARARQLAAHSAAPLITTLTRTGMVSERDHARACAQALSLPLLEADDAEKRLETLPPDLAGLPLRFLRQFHAFPLAINESGMDLWLAEPWNPYIVDAITLATGRVPTLWVGLSSSIDDALERWFATGRTAMGAISDGIESTVDQNEDLDHLRDLASEAPVIRLVNLIIQGAVQTRASDIHVEPFETRLKVRYRVDGVLVDAESPPAGLTAAVISRIKIMARLDIAERRLPQDGRIMVRVQGKELDLRVSTMPTAHGESVVMRLLDRETVTLDFEALGFEPAFMQALGQVLAQPHGIVLVTGPTGSGKTTTLYAALTRLNTPEVKIITVEDPIEYQLEGVNQIQAKPQIGLDFSQALRSIVRQDPDVIMIGEMRDVETARIAIQSALTGHLVLSTLHTNNAAGGITRLLDMGVEDYLLTSTINGIVAQRLVRRLDPHSAQRYLASDEEVEKFGLRAYQPDGDIFLYRAQPSVSTPTGYRGRTTLVELLTMNDALRSAVIRKAGTSELEAIARQSGMRTMYEDGVAKALRGETTLEEVLRVTEDA